MPKNPKSTQRKGCFCFNVLPLGSFHRRAFHCRDVFPSGIFTVGRSIGGVPSPCVSPRRPIGASSLRACLRTGAEGCFWVGGASGLSEAVRFSPFGGLLPFGRLSPVGLVLSAGSALALRPCPCPSCLRERRTARSLSLDGSSRLSQSPSLAARWRTLPPALSGTARRGRPRASVVA